MPSITLRQHVRSHTATLLSRMASEVRRAMRRADPETIHDLRVAIRRLRECLRTFAAAFPEVSRRRVRGELRGLTKAAEKVRSADIALELLHGAEVGQDDPLIAKVKDQREHYGKDLQAVLTTLSKRPYIRIWRRELGL